MMTRGRTRQPPLRFGGRGRGPARSDPARQILHSEQRPSCSSRSWRETHSPHSASTLHREQHDPAVRLGAAAARYLDALHLAAEHLTDPQVAASLDQSADHLLKGLQVSRHGRPCVATCCCWPPPAPIRSLNYSPPPQRGALARAHDQAAVIDSRIHDIKEVATGGPLPWLPGIPHRSPPTAVGDPTWTARSNLVTQLADQVRRNAAGEAPAWAAQPAHSRSGRVDRRRAGVARRHPGRPQRPATHRATPAQPRHPSLATATRQATWRRRQPCRPAMAATSRHRSPQRHGGPLYAGACRKVEQPHPSRLRCHPARAVGGRRGTPTRRPPRRSPLVAHPRPATGNAEPGACNPRGSPSDPAHDHDLTRQAATAAALGAPSRVRAEPLKTSTHHNAGRSVSQDLLPNPSADQGRLLRGGDWHSSGAGYDISVRDGSARRSGQLSGDASDLRKHDVPQGGTPGGVRRR